MFTFYKYIYGFLLCEGNLITNVCGTGVGGWRLSLDCLKFGVMSLLIDTAHIRLDVFVHMHDTLPKPFFFFFFYFKLLFGSNI